MTFQHDHAFVIDSNSCVECGQCRRFCPLPGAIIINQDYQHVVVNDACTGCGLCAAFCPVPGALKQVAPQAVAVQPQRLKALRRVVWRGKWRFHNHPLMGKVTADARQSMRRASRMERTALPL